jgi:hypothetical protein
MHLGTVSFTRHSWRLGVLEMEQYLACESPGVFGSIGDVNRRPPPRPCLCAATSRGRACSLAIPLFVSPAAATSLSAPVPSPCPCLSRLPAVPCAPPPPLADWSRGGDGIREAGRRRGDWRGGEGRWWPATARSSAPCCAAACVSHGRGGDMGRD